MRMLLTAVALVTLATAACAQDSYLKESPQQIRQEQVTADAHNESTSTTTGTDGPPATELDGDMFGAVRVPSRSAATP
jgi:hypothetical protein